jgi:CBS domain-containing protein
MPFFADVVKNGNTMGAFQPAVRRTLPMDLAKVVRVPAITAYADTTIIEAVRIMAEHDVGAIVITDASQKVLGIFTERDNMLRVTLKRLDPAKTTLAEVMSAPVITAPPDISATEAMSRMIKHRYRHLPVVDADNRILGVVSVRQLLMRRVSEQQGSIEALSAYVNAGGPG